MLLRWLRNEYVHAGGVLSAVCLFFLSWSILNYQDHIFSPVGLLQKNTLTRVTENPPWVNPYLGDVVYVIQPWLLHNRDSVHAGRLPLWNPYNGNGMPHLANFQSATFSVFTLPFYVLDFKAAALVSSFLALFAHGFFAFAFLKQIRLHQAAALTGAVAYMFGGYHVLWLGWLPLVGSGVTLPAALFFTEATFNRLQSGDGAQRGVFWLLAGFTASLLVGLLAGHPETFYAGLVLTAAYVAFRLLRWWKHLGWSRQSALRVLVLGGQFITAALLALLIAGAQWLPFLEYLTQTSLRGALQKSAVQLPLGILPLLFFPSLLGNPSTGYRPILEIQGQLWNFPESVSLYCGSLTLLLAALSLWLMRRNWHARFFGVVAVMWLVYVFNLFSTRELFKFIPGVSVVLPIRTYDIWLFSVSCGAAIFLDHSLKWPKSSLKWAVVVLLAGAALLATGWGLATELLRRFSEVVFRDATGFVDGSLTHIAAMSGSLLAGVALLAALFLTSGKWARGMLAGALALVVFYQGGYAFKPYNPIARDELFYPRPAILQRLQQTVGDATVVILGEDTIPPNVNMVYGLRLLTGYDGFWGRPQRRLYRALFDAPPDALSPSMKADPRALQLFGVEYVATIGQNDPINGAADFKLLWQDGGVRLYRYAGSLTRYYTLDSARVVESAEAAWDAIRAPEFDPSRAVLLIGSPTATPSPTAQRARAAQVLSDSGDAITLKVTREQPGYLALALTHDPGWKAIINGSPQVVLRANYTFSAVQIPAGESVIELYYDPDSFKIGVALSGLGLALAGVLIVANGLRRRSARAS